MTENNGPWGQLKPASPPPAPKPAPAPMRPLLLWIILCAALGGLVLALAHAFPEAVRTGDDWARVARSAGVAAIVAAGLVRSRRMLGPQHLKYAAAWAGVIAVLALGFAYRGELGGVVQHLEVAFGDGAGVATGEHELVVPQDADGGYALVAKVNGQRVRFAIDTGASDTVLSPDDARRIGVDMTQLRYVVESETANGKGYGAPYVADRFEVGSLVLSNFKLTVNQAPLSTSLLGVSFLSKLESFRVEDGKLILRWR